MSVGVSWRSTTQRRYFSSAKVLLIINLIFIGGIFIKGLSRDAFKPHLTTADLAYYNGHQLIFTGQICAAVDTDYQKQRLTVCAAGKTLVTTDLYPSYDYGDFIQVNGYLQAPPLIQGFDYESYLARYDIYSVMYYPDIKLIAGKLTASQQIYAEILQFRKKLKDIIDSHLLEPEAGLAAALLLGYRRSVDRDTVQMFARVGLSHVMAISGTHITILSALLINFLSILGISRRRTLVFVFLFLGLYPILTGLAASAIRAAIMGGLAFLSFYYQRTNSLINSLVLVATIMLLINPQLLQRDVGFQLSFLAVLGIIYLYPIGVSWSQHYLMRQSWRLTTRQFVQNVFNIFNITLSVQVITLPIVLINFQQLSLISPLANLFVLWTLPFLLTALLLGLVGSGVASILGVWPFLPANCLLKFIFVLIRLLAAPRWAAWSISHFNWYWGVMYYLSLSILVIIMRRRRRYLLS